MRIITWMFVTALLLWGTSLFATIRLPRFFSDNMILQRDMPLKIWGWADRNEKISVCFNGHEVTTVVEKSGEWAVELPPMKYGGPFEMIIRGKDNTVTFQNIMLGDVWICSGQSNMEWILENTRGAAQEIAGSTNPNIRLLTIEKTIRSTEMNDISGGSWEICSPQAACSFSAVGYYFGKNLQQELQIPIGLINNAWGGTNIQTWISWENIVKSPNYKKFAGKSIAQVDHSFKKSDEYNKALENDEGLKAKWYDPEVKTTDWQKTNVPGRWNNELKDELGAVWFRKEIVLPEGVKTGKINLGTVSNEDITYINGVLLGQCGRWDKIRTYAIPESILKNGKNLIVIRIKNIQGGAGIYGKPENLWLEADGQKYPLAGDWEYKPSVRVSTYGIKPKQPNSFASLLYNGMLKPLVGYGIKGVIWYQGESNAEEAYKYQTLFPMLIENWRQQWGSEFPFLWVQLANYKAVKEQPSESDWAELREAQNMALRLPKTGQTVITDIGEAGNIHPQNKKDVGYRLMQNALKVAYGKNILGAGPVYENMKKDGNQIILTFGNTGKGLMTADHNKYGYVRGFTIAGADQNFVWAKAYITDNYVVVFNEKIKDPVAVRYAWADNPEEANLVNSDGLLTSPFRTDKWKGITENIGK